MARAVGVPEGVVCEIFSFCMNKSPTMMTHAAWSTAASIAVITAVVYQWGVPQLPPNTPAITPWVERVSRGGFRVFSSASVAELDSAWSHAPVTPVRAHGSPRALYLDASGAIESEHYAPLLTELERSVLEPRAGAAAHPFSIPLNAVKAHRPTNASTGTRVAQNGGFLYYDKSRPMGCSDYTCGGSQGPRGRVALTQHEVLGNLEGYAGVGVATKDGDGSAKAGYVTLVDLWKAIQNSSSQGSHLYATWRAHSSVVRTATPLMTTVAELLRLSNNEGESSGSGAFSAPNIGKEEANSGINIINLNCWFSSPGTVSVPVHV